MPVVSVVLPVYNGERFLRDAMDSILHQTFADFEFIIIDDGSTDGTGSIIRSFKDPRIHVLRHEHNQGIVDSLNHGIQKATGKYICRMDADDVSLPTRLERQMEFLEKNSDVAVLGTNTIVINGESTEIRRESYPQSHKEIMKRIFIGNPFAHGTTVMRLEVLKESGTYDGRFLHNEDYDLWLRIASRHSLANLDEALVKRRVHGSNITVEKETELVYYRFRTLAHAVFIYYKRPWLVVFLVRPLLAFLYRSMKRVFR